MKRLAWPSASSTLCKMGEQQGGAPEGQALRNAQSSVARRLLLGATALGLLACGGQSASPSLPPAVDGSARGDAGAARPPDEIVPLPQRDEAEPPAPDAAASAEPPPPSSDELALSALGGPVRDDVVALAVLESLQWHCGECHSSADNGEGFAGGFDLGELIARGMIVPGSSATSPIVQNIRHGTPTPGLRPGVPTAGDVALISDFIDRLRPEPLPSCEPLPFLSLDEAWAEILDDVNNLPEGDGPYLRYVGLSYASNAGACGAALDEQRHALFKLVNTLSTARDVRRPEPIDAEERLYRIDLRDYRWNRNIDIDADGAPDHPDVWAAIAAAAGGFAFELTGPEASAVALQTGSPVPYLPANALVAAASQSEVYHAVAGIRPSLVDTQLARGIDIVVVGEQGAWRRAGFQREKTEGVLVTRAPQGAPPGDHWMLEVQSEVRDSSLYSDALELDFGDWSKSIFRLPNGLMAFSANARDARLGSIPNGCFGPCEPPELPAPSACHACHAGGLLPLEDRLRELVQSSLEYAGREEELATAYPSHDEMAGLIAADNAAYLSALDQAGVPRGGADPISRVDLQFTRDPISLARAAAELGVTAETLRERLGELPAELAPLADPAASIERGALARAALGALCVLGERNRPVQCP